VDALAVESGSVSRAEKAERAERAPVAPLEPPASL